MGAKGNLILRIGRIGHEEEGDDLARTLREGVVEDDGIVTTFPVLYIMAALGELVCVALPKLDHLFQTNVFQSFDDLGLV